MFPLILVALFIFFLFSGDYYVALFFLSLFIFFGSSLLLSNYLHARKWNKLTPEQQKLRSERTSRELRELIEENKATERRHSYNSIANYY